MIGHAPTGVKAVKGEGAGLRAGPPPHPALSPPDGGEG
jgi:hypothetical protein